MFKSINDNSLISTCSMESESRVFKGEHNMIQRVGLYVSHVSHQKLKRSQHKYLNHFICRTRFMSYFRTVVSSSVNQIHLLCRFVPQDFPFDHADNICNSFVISSCTAQNCSRLESIVILFFLSLVRIQTLSTKSFFPAFNQCCIWCEIVFDVTLYL